MGVGWGGLQRRNEPNSHAGRRCSTSPSSETAPRGEKQLFLCPLSTVPPLDKTKKVHAREKHLRQKHR